MHLLLSFIPKFCLKTNSDISVDIVEPQLQGPKGGGDEEREKKKKQKTKRRRGQEASMDFSPEVRLLSFRYCVKYWGAKNRPERIEARIGQVLCRHNDKNGITIDRLASRPL